MRARLKRNGPRAAATARKAKTVPLRKRTRTFNPIAPSDANDFACEWVARRYRLRTRWAAVIAEAAGLGGRP